MRRFRGLLLCALAFTACRDLNLPTPPAPPGPGTMQGNLVYAAPGRSSLEPAVGAVIRLSNSSAEVKSNGDGYFNLQGLTSAEGSVLIQFDVDRDGAPDRQRRISLAEVGAGFGKNIALGQVVLGRNATVQGSALRGDLATSRTGHAGTSVFVPEGPFATTTADDGSFLLENMPEGPLTLAFFRPGYDSTVATTGLRAGERLALEPVLLEKKATADLPGTLEGRVVRSTGDGLAGAQVSTPLGRLATTDADGHFSGSLPSGVYTVTFAASGFVTLAVPNVLVPSNSTSTVSVQLLDTGSGASGGGGGTTGGGGGTTGGGGGATGGGGGATGGGGGATGGGATGGGGGATGGGAATGGGSGDGGQLPIAVITPLPTFFNPGTAAYARLEGDLSTGVAPLVYHWRQLTPPDGGLFDNLDNDSETAFQLMVPLNIQRAQYGIELRVTDALGVTSAPATATLTSCLPPFAAITSVPTDPVLGGATFTLSSTSIDTNSPPLPITRFEWTNLVGNATLTPVMALNGRDVVVTAPNVSSATTLRIGLRAFNAYGAPSLQSQTADITVVPNPVAVDGGNWVLFAEAYSFPSNAPEARGESISVPELAVVELRADAGTPPPGVTWSYDWSPKSEPATGPFDWQLTNDQSAVATFVAPVVRGPTRQLNFTVQVTATGSGVTPTMQTRNLLVAVVDRTPPVIVSSTVNAGNGSIFGVILTFDEPVQLQDRSDIVLYDANSFGTVAYAEQLGPRTVYVKPELPLSPGNQYVVYVAAARDTSPLANSAVPYIYTTFTAGLSLSLPFKSSQTSVREPVPGLLVKNDPGQERIQAFGRRWNGSAEVTWFLDAHPAFDFSCVPNPGPGNPCPVASKTAGVSATLTPDAGTPTHRGYTLGGKPVALFQSQGLAGASSTVALTTDAMDQGANLSFDAGLPGALATTPDDLWSLGRDGTGNLQLRKYDTFTGTNTLETVNLDGGVGANEPFAFGAVGQRGLIIANRAGDFVYAWNSSRGWQYDANLTALPFTSARVLGQAWPPLHPYPASWVVPFLEPWDNSGFPEQRMRILQVLQYSTPSVSLTGTIPLGNVGSFDAILDGQYLLLAYVESGVLRVAATYALALTPEVLPGAHAAPFGAMNLNPACEARNPELARTRDFVYLVWQERCLGQDWNVVFRILH